MIHVFHGFLGSPADFDFLKRDDVIIHDLYHMDDYPEIHPEDFLIGYSMGGRIALEIAQKVQYQLRKLVLINAHPGLGSDEEKKNRVVFEDRILNEMRSKTKDEFLGWWNSLPIFKADLPINTTDERFKQSAELFEAHRLSQQENHLPHLIAHQDKVLFIAGLADEKYMDLVCDLLVPNDIPVIGIEGGHRLFQKQEELTDILKSQGIL